MNSYIDEQGISLYLKDALNQFCQLRRSKPSLKSSPLSPGAYDQSNIAQFLSEYCRSVQYGTHLYKREYEYIMLTTRNRLSFIRLIEKQFLAGLIGYDEISATDFYSLIELLCPDFPQTVIQDAFKLIHDDDTQIQNILKKLRFRLFFDDFFEEARSELITENIKNRKIVVPTSEAQNVEKEIKLPLSGRCQKSDT